MSDRPYIDIAQEVLNREYGLNLEKNITLLNTRKYFDLVDLSNAVVVKIKESISTNYNDKSYVILKHHIDEVAVNFKADFRFFLAVNSSVPSDERKFLIKFLEDIDPEVKVGVLSSEDIDRMDSGGAEKKEKPIPKQKKYIASIVEEEDMGTGISSDAIGSSAIADSNDLRKDSSNGENDDLPEENPKDKIPFHLDNVENVDRLNREPVAKSLARLINTEIFANRKLQHSFMIHLQGEWGSGKSTFLNLVEQHLETDTQKWAVIKYNAWQNQHMSPPWWTFIDQIYRQTLLKMKGFNCIRLYFKENSRRVLWYSGWYNIITLVISIVLLIVIVKYGDEIVGKISGSITLEGVSKQEKIDLKNKFKIYTELLLGLGSIVGIIFSFSKFISTPLLMKSSGEAKSFVLRASDPMNRIKKHFKKLIKDINKRGCEVAVFIDDIDRCNKEYTVELLEGIQTLFKDKRVLYIVAGDKNWITTCFSKNYEDFIGNVTKHNEDLGELFLEKAFQLSVRMPNVSEQTKEQYWYHILGAKETVKSKKVLAELTVAERNEIKKRVVKNYADSAINKTRELDDLEEKYGLSEESISDIAIEALDESSKDIKHLFLNHYKLIDPNPRAIKRLANNYTMYRNTLIAERKNFNPNKLFRWLILQTMYPKIVQEVLLHGDFNFLDNQLNTSQLDDKAKNDVKELINDTKDLYGGVLLKEELELITGI